MSDRSNANLRPFLYDLEKIVDELKHRLPCCPNCEHFTQGHCTYQGQRLVPPPEVIAFGCWAFEAIIPF